MRKIVLACLILSLFSHAVSAQRPIRQLLPLRAYTLQDYQAIAFADALALPSSIEASSYAGVAMNAQDNLIILSRGTPTFLEFEKNGRFVRSFGADNLFNRSHGLHIDKDNNIWATDVSDHVVLKLDSDGNVLMSLGTKGESGAWDESTGSHLFSQPNDVALDSIGNIYVAQGHGGDFPGILKFSPSGEFITKWGSKGYGPGEFVTAHAIEIDADDVLYVADRESMRVQRYDTSGNMLREWKFDAMVCAMFLHSDGNMYITTGFDGELAKVDMDGNVLGSIGSPGTGNGQFGEAHALTLDSENNAYISDVILNRIQKFAKQ